MKHRVEPIECVSPKRAKWVCLPSSWGRPPQGLRDSKPGARFEVRKRVAVGTETLPGLGCFREPPTSKGETEAQSPTQGHRAVQQSLD